MDRYWSFNTHRLRKAMLLARRLLFLEETAHKTAHLTARLLIEQTRARGVLPALADAEFQVYSQWGDDGIIQYLLSQVAVRPAERAFVEFGVQDYREANTRFLLVNNNWRGLVLDDNPANVAIIGRDPIFWQHRLTAARAFVTADNVNALLAEHGFAADLGLLHIDIDGNDYWVWRAFDVTRPVIAIIEYNAVFGAEHALTVPYDPAFDRSRAHYSNLFFGASLGALCDLASAKGYAFVGCNSAGNNAYFVRRDRLGALPALSPADGFVDAAFRESVGRDGRSTYLSGAARQREIAECIAFDTRSNSLVRVGDRLGAG
ncbi:MAG: hypothetical protein AVDCRST_MAG11-2174 [uncultured Gemmatimonadaceae bacterium]|uniref:Uncharacterized protein n=1 Tax=uncultured Gemmatimonadaceae bacterium TaxID=246130 RepID=A0A6J4L5L5_9BACT|nr:MAG: hypothetical protein AVDCRST_MAG11-2174 [uncultured Gemmatimonadaceae bacterium]